MEGGIVISESSQLDYIAGIDAAFFVFRTIDKPIIDWMESNKSANFSYIISVDQLGNYDRAKLDLIDGFLGSTQSFQTFTGNTGES